MRRRTPGAVEEPFGAVVVHGLQKPGPRRATKGNPADFPSMEGELDRGPPPTLAGRRWLPGIPYTRIDELLADLPLNQREVVRLKFQNQLSYQEIAAVTSLSVGNVGFLLHTALKTLRSRLDRLERTSPFPPTFSADRNSNVP